MGSIILLPIKSKEQINKYLRMSQSNQGFFMTGDQTNGFSSNPNENSSFNQNQNNSSFNNNNNNNSSNNRASVITVNWEKEVDNVFMDEIGKFSKQCDTGFKF